MQCEAVSYTVPQNKLLIGQSRPEVTIIKDCILQQSLWAVAPM
jgi:hypothetical protein